MERSEPDGHEARAGSAKQESGNKQVEEKVPNFPLHLKHELLPAIHEIWQERVRVKVSRRGMATFVGAERADVEEAIRQYEDLRRKAEEKYRALSKLYTEEGAEEVSVYRFRNAINVESCVLKDHRVISSYSWDTANASEPYSVPGRLRTYCKPPIPCARKDEGKIDVKAPLPKKEKHKDGEEGEEEEVEKEASGKGQQQQQVVEIIRMACRALLPDFSLDRYDIVTNRNNLRKIFCWACDNRSRWRINIEKISPTTVSMSRFDLEDSDIAKRNQVIADEFEAACCGYTQDAYRAVIQCNIADINFLVQCEVDCAMPACSSSSDSTSTPEDQQLPNRNIDSEQIHEIAGSGLLYRLTSEPLAPPFVELKTCHPGRFKRPYEHIEYILDIWFQSYLAGVKKLVFGIKDREGGIGDVREYDALESFLADFKGEYTHLHTRARKALAKTMNVVSWIKQQMANKPVGAKYYLLGWNRCIKLYRSFPEVASSARLIEKLGEDEAWQVLTDLLRSDVIPDPRAPLLSLLRADPALYLPLLQQRLSGQQAE